MLLACWGSGCWGWLVEGSDRESGGLREETEERSGARSVMTYPGEFRAAPMRRSTARRMTTMMN